MPPRMDDTKRQTIIDTIRDSAGNKSTGALAKELGVSRTTIHRLAKEAGLEGIWERSQTENATRAREADMAELRSQTAARFLHEANKMLDRLNEPCEVFAFGGAENRFNSHVLDRPPSAEVRNFMTSAAIAMDKHVLLDKHDTSETGGAAVDAWLRHIIGGETQM